MTENQLNSIKAQPMIRVLLVDDQAMIRAGIRMILESAEDVAIVAEAGDGDAALVQARAANPDVILMDVQMPILDGIEATRKMRAENIRAHIIILTTFERDDYLFGALAAGASGFLLKNSPPEELVRAVRTVASGDALLDPTVTRRVIARVGKPNSAAKTDALSALSEREREVFFGLARGQSNAEIAASLYLGEATVKTHVSNLLAKLALRDRVQAVIFAYEHGVIAPGAD
jgi:DNA-binding NarL/FixJ family response regulator